MEFKLYAQGNMPYVITEECIKETYYTPPKVTKGLLVRQHYHEVVRALEAAIKLRSGEVAEYLSYCGVVSEERLKNAFPLNDVVSELESLLDILTDGGYSNTVEYYEGNCTRHETILKDIGFDLRLLKERKYYEALRVPHRGVPRITTIGNRLVNMVIVLVQAIDNEGL